MTDATRPSDNRSDIENIASKHTISDVQTLSTWIDHAWLAYWDNRFHFDDLPTLSNVRDKIERAAHAARKLEALIVAMDDGLTWRWFQKVPREIALKFANTSDDLQYVLEQRSGRDIMSEGLDFEPQRRGLFRQDDLRDDVILDLSELVAVLQLMKENAYRAARQAETTRDDIANNAKSSGTPNPTTEKNRGVRQAIRALREYWINHLKRNFTANFDERVQPTSPAALFVRSAFELIDRAVELHTIRVEMRKVIRESNSVSSK